MAIDLQFTAAPVQRFQLSDPRKGEAEITSRLKRSAAKASSQQATLGKLADTITDVAYQQESLRNERELQLASMNMQAAETARIEESDRHLYYNGDELPESINVRGGRYVQQGGADVPRKIPRWEVEPDLMRQQSLDAMNDSASFITSRRNRDRFIANQTGQIEDTYQRGLINSLQEQKQHMMLELTSEVSLLSRNGKFFQAKQMIDSSSLLTDQQRAQAKSGLDKSEEVYGMKSLINRQDLSEGERQQVEALIVGLEDKGYKGNLNQDERIGMQNSLKQKLSRDQSEKDAEFSHERGQYVSDLNLAITVGDPAVDEVVIQEAYDDKMITASEMTTMKRALLVSRKEQTQELLSRAEYNIRIDGDMGLDPRNKDFKKFVDEDFNAALNQLEATQGGSSPEDFYRVGIQVARQTGIAPETMIKEMRGANRNNTTALMQAAHAYNDVINISPKSLDDFPEHDTSLVSSVGARLKMGMSESEAIESAIADRDLTDSQRNMRKEIMQEAKKSPQFWGQSAMTQSLRDSMDGDSRFQIPMKFRDVSPTAGLPGAPQVDDIPAEMVSQYEALIESFLPMEGYNMGAASQKAFERISQDWGITNVNNPDSSFFSLGNRGFQIMPFPPQGDPQLIHNDIQAKYSEGLKEGERVLLSHDAITILKGQAGVDIDYPIWIIDSDDNVRLAEDRWTWDQETAQAAEDTRSLAEAEEKRKLIEFQRQRRKDELSFYGTSGKISKSGRI